MQSGIWSPPGEFRLAPQHQISLVFFEHILRQNVRKNRRTFIMTFLLTYLLTYSLIHSMVQDII